MKVWSWGSSGILGRILSIFKPTQSWQDNPNPKGLPMYPIVVESKIACLTIESIPTANHYFSCAVYQIEFFSCQWKSLLKTRCCNWRMNLWHWNELNLQSACLEENKIGMESFWHSICIWWMMQGRESLKILHCLTVHMHQHCLNITCRLLVSSTSMIWMVYVINGSEPICESKLQPKHLWLVQACRSKSRDTNWQL